MNEENLRVDTNDRTPKKKAPSLEYCIDTLCRFFPQNSQRERGDSQYKNHCGINIGFLGGEFVSTPAQLNGKCHIPI